MASLFLLSRGTPSQLRSTSLLLLDAEQILLTPGLGNDVVSSCFALLDTGQHIYRVEGQDKSRPYWRLDKALNCGICS